MPKRAVVAQEPTRPPAIRRIPVCPQEQARAPFEPHAGPRARAAIVLMGSPGSGKTTLARALAQRNPASIIEVGSLLKREVQRGTKIGKAIKPFISTGNLAPLTQVTKIVSRELRNARENIVLFDGIPRSKEQIVPFLKLLAGHHLNLRAVILLALKLQTALRRLEGRRVCEQCGALYSVPAGSSEQIKTCERCGGELIQRQDDREEVVRERFKRFEHETLPVVEFFKKEFGELTWEQSATAPPRQRVDQVWRRLQRNIAALPSRLGSGGVHCAEAMGIIAMKIGAKTARAEKSRTLTARRAPVVLTIGHSTRTLDEFVRVLQAHGVSRVVDVRTVPRSRHNPQFNKASLPQALKKAGLKYVHLPGLGGLRHAKPDSPNAGWHNASFRGFADYMQTPEFARSLEELIQLATQEQVALMCAEAVPWRCHRSLIADALLVHGIRTEDIMSLVRRQVHTLTPFAKVRGITITYPARDQRSDQKKLLLKRSRGQPTPRSRDSSMARCRPKGS